MILRQLTHFSVKNLKHLFTDLILNIETFRNSEVNEFLDLDKTRLRLKKCATKGRSLSLAQKEAPERDLQRLGFVPKNASIQNTTSFTSIMLSAVLQNKVEKLIKPKENNLATISISLKSVQKTYTLVYIFLNWNHILSVFTKLFLGPRREKLHKKSAFFCST